MTDQTATNGHPAEPADLFVHLYDALPESLFLGWTATRWYDDPEVRRQATGLSETVLETGVLDPAVTARLVGDHGHRGRFTVLLALDIALAHANPYGPYYDAPALFGVAARYLTEGRFNGDGTTGALLPRCAYPGRPRGRRTKAEFFGVHRITPEQWAKVDHSVLPPALDPHFSRDEPVSVGCAPVLENFDELDITFEARHGLTVYRIAPRDEAIPAARIATILRRLDEAGAQIAVMPETSLSDGLLERWKEAAFDSAGRDRSKHPLRFIMLGSGPLGGGDPPPNRAVLLDRWTGKEILVQDKMSGFTMDAEQLRLWRLPGAPATGSADEYVAPGTRIGLLDSSLGRLAILICEDLSRSTGWEREAQACGVSHLLVPIFSKPILRFRWEQLAAERQVVALGCWVVVANSLAVGHAIPAGELPGPRYTCLVVGPEGVGRDGYGADIQFGRAKTGDELGIDEVGGLPKVLPGAVYDPWLAHWPTTN